MYCDAELLPCAPNRPQCSHFEMYVCIVTLHYCENKAKSTTTPLFSWRRKVKERRTADDDIMVHFYRADPMGPGALQWTTTPIWAVCARVY